MGTRALVIGATGYTGHHVVQQLRSADIETVAHVRPDSSQGEVWEGRFESYGADVSRAPWDLLAMKSTYTPVLLMIRA